MGTQGRQLICLLISVPFLTGRSLLLGCLTFPYLVPLASGKLLGTPERPPAPRCCPGELEPWPSSPPPWLRPSPCGHGVNLYWGCRAGGWLRPGMVRGDVFEQGPHRFKVGHILGLPYFV